MTPPAMGIDPNRKQVAGKLGVLMLDTRFPRWPGDIGHDAGLCRPALRFVVPGAVPAEVVTDAAALVAGGWAERFAAGARALQAAGAGVVTTSCGFLVLLQAALQRAVPVPLVSSALLQLPVLLARGPQVGVLTIDARRLGAAHLRAAGVPEERLADVIVEGLDPAGPFARPILDNATERDASAAEADLAAAARRLAARAPRLRTVVLECTNMAPHAAAIERASGLQARWLRHDPALAACFAEAEGA